jgi:hypothetical protein
MKTIMLMIFLATLQISRGGQIADQYWQQRRTNDLASSGALSPPKLPPTTHGITEIGIERTPCFGSCPAYVCVIRSNGTVRYHGQAHVAQMGDWDAKIDPYSFHNLANFIVGSGYTEMQDTFASNVTDGDTVYTTFVIKGHRKVFRNYASSGPAKLWALQQLIDSLVAGAAWQRSGTSMETQPNPQGGANGRQPFSPVTNPTPAAAASRRSS